MRGEGLVSITIFLLDNTRILLVGTKAAAFFGGGPVGEMGRVISSIKRVQGEYGTLWSTHCTTA